MLCFFLQIDIHEKSTNFNLDRVKVEMKDGKFTHSDFLIYQLLFHVCQCTVVINVYVVLILGLPSFLRLSSFWISCSYLWSSVILNCLIQELFKHWNFVLYQMSFTKMEVLSDSEFHIIFHQKKTKN